MAPRISVNLPPHWFESPRFFRDVIAVLREEDVQPSAIVFELTEDGILKMEETELFSRAERLREMGFGFSIDDFGVANSNIGRLVQLPFDEIKLDRSLILHMKEPNVLRVREKARGIIKWIIEGAASMGAHVVAEGLEDFSDVEQLRSMNCHYGQGYFFKKAMPFDEVSSWLRENPPVPYAMAA